MTHNDQLLQITGGAFTALGVSFWAMSWRMAVLMMLKFDGDGHDLEWLHVVVRLARTEPAG